jgi:hypothetical protein|tara:strand:- start:222 stop:455 length:234 start_codon:yes stop_codon:yes gene_type:complete
MPLYTLKDIKTRDTWEVTCSWNELQETLDTMPDVIQVLSTPKIVSGTGSTLSKTDDGWKEVLNKVKSGSGRDNTIKT